MVCSLMLVSRTEMECTHRNSHSFEHNVIVIVLPEIFLNWLHDERGNIVLSPKKKNLEKRMKLAKINEKILRL